MVRVEQLNLDRQNRESQQLRDAAGNLLEQLSELYYLTSPKNDGTTPLTVDAVREGKSRSYQASNLLQLVCSQALANDARSLFVATCDYVDEVLVSPRNAAESVRLRARMNATREDYLNAVRKELGKSPIDFPSYKSVR